MKGLIPTPGSPGAHAILTIRDVAQELGFHPITIYRLAERGELPAFKVGGRWRFRRDLLDRWILDRTGISSSQGRKGRRNGPHSDAG